MSMISGISARRETAAAGMVASVWGALKRGWLAYMSWRMERLAVARLQTMSDRQLTDIGIVRSEIECAVRHGTSRDRIVSLAGLCFCALCLSI